MGAIRGRMPVWLPLALVAGLLVLRAAQVRSTPVDTDEPQHLHIAHGIVQGEMPYRDRFDNHTPLLHFALAPWMSAHGERADIVGRTRLLLTPLVLAALACFVWAGGRAFGFDVALWGTALLLALPDWVMCSVQVRPDLALMTTWFAALAWLVRGRPVPSPGAWLVAGLLLGIGLLFSLKASLLFGALGLAAGGCWLLREDCRTPLPTAACSIGAALMGFALPILAGVAWLQSAGLWEDARYCLLELNSSAVDGSGGRMLLFVGLLIAGAAAIRTAPSPMQALLLGVTATTAAVILGLSPTLRKQTLLPLYPLLFLSAVAMARRQKGIPVLSDLRRPGVIAVVVMVAYGVIQAPPWMAGRAAHEAMLTAVITHVPRSETVMDSKGETIYRKRPEFLAYVGVVNDAIRSGVLKDRCVEAAIRNGTIFATDSTRHLPKASRRFFQEHYLPVGNGLRVLGSVVREGKAEVVIAGAYALVQESGEAGVPSERPVGELDLPGTPDGAFLVAVPGLPLFQASIEKPEN